MTIPPTLLPVLQHWAALLGDVTVWEALHHKQTVFRLTTATGAQFILKQLPRRLTPAQRATEYQVLAYLHDCAIPVAVPILTAHQQHCAEYDGQSYSLMPALPSTGYPEPYDPATVYRNIGCAIGRLHLALASYPAPLVLQTMDLAQNPETAIIPVLRRQLAPTRLANIEPILASVQEALTQRFAKLPTQRIHGDCHSSNLLCAYGDVSGFIDFDYLQIGPRIYDLCYFLADVVRMHIAQPAALELWLAHFAQVIAGYEQYLPLTAAEKAALWHGMLATQLLFTYTFEKFCEVERMHEALATLGWLYQQRQAITAAL